jgi:hypothetical protein
LSTRVLAYVRDLTDIKKVVILGHGGGGGAIVSECEDVPENDASACQGSEKIYPCSNAMDGLEHADGLMFLNANYGRSTMALISYKKRTDRGLARPPLNCLGRRQKLTHNLLLQIQVRRLGI